MTKNNNNQYLVSRTGKLDEGENFYNTIVKPLNENNLDKVRWGVNIKSIGKKLIKDIKKDLQNGKPIYLLLIPSAPYNCPYAICELKDITERNLGPLIVIDDTNEEIGWNKKTIYNNSGFEIEFKFSKIYKHFNKKIFENIKLKGQKSFFKLRKGIKNEHYYYKILEEFKIIEQYVQPIILD
jgi:hypothetical protein